MNRPCARCKIRVAEHRHHLFSQIKYNREKYGNRLDHPGNIMYLCSICHLNKSIPKLREDEFLEATSDGNMNTLLIQGIVLCKECKGQIISNTGKVMYNKDHTLQCWGCGRIVMADDAYKCRKENQIVEI